MLSAGAAIREDPESAAGACCWCWCCWCWCCWCWCCWCCWCWCCWCWCCWWCWWWLLRRRLLFLPFHVWSHFVLVIVYVRRTWVLTLPRVVFVVAPCDAARVCALASFSGLGWTTIYLNNTYGSIQHGIGITILYAQYGRSYCLVWFSGRYDNIVRSQYRRGTREAFVHGAGSFV